MTATVAFEKSLRTAMTRRAVLIDRLATDHTDCYRLFHGTQEGVPGVTLDRYGDLVLLQSFHAPVGDDEVVVVRRVLDEIFPDSDLVYNDRSAPGSRIRNRLSDTGRPAAELDRVVFEHGVRFHIKARHRGHDPWLFLDLRTTRRAVMDESRDRSVLNLFAYTCGVGVAAAAAGARRVLNVDFAESSLAVGTANALLNGVTHCTTELVSDVFPTVRQLAGIRQPPVVRGRRLPRFPHLEPESFELVFLDPPTLAKSPFGVVDLVRDYQSLLKPALGAVAAGGILYCTCHVARVEEREWHAQLRRCAEKCGRPIRSLDVLRPGEDFPSADDRPPLKVARLAL
jgi:23S rRNA (cytosine1962-C5)-methyltransferase